MLGRILLGDEIASSIPLDDPNVRNLVEEVSSKVVRKFRSKTCEVSPQNIRKYQQFGTLSN